MKKISKICLVGLIIIITSCATFKPVYNASNKYDDSYSLSNIVEKNDTIYLTFNKLWSTDESFIIEKYIDYNFDGVIMKGKLIGVEYGEGINYLNVDDIGKERVVVIR